MLPTIIGNFTRQSKALALLLQLMQEEFSLLMSRAPRDVTKIEFSIQELMGQLMAERKSVKAALHNMRLREYLEALPNKEHPRNKERIAQLDALIEEIEKLEQECARQAAKNSRLVLALMDQSEKLLSHLHSQIRPHKNESYSKHGTFAKDRPEATLIQGRL